MCIVVVVMNANRHGPKLLYGVISTMQMRVTYSALACSTCRGSCRGPQNPEFQDQKQKSQKRLEMERRLTCLSVSNRKKSADPNRPVPGNCRGIDGDG